MKNILCFGDSITWGWNPEVPRDRHEPEDRWPNILQEKLGANFHVIPEGCSGRTTVLDDHVSPGRNGMKVFASLLESHRPLDLIIIMLGTNDLKVKYHVSALDIAMGVGELVKLAKGYPCGQLGGKQPEILLVSPILLGERVMETQGGPWTFDAGSIAKSRELSRFYAEIAQQHGCHFADAALWAEASKADQVHLDREGQHALANGMYEAVKNVFNV